MTSAELLRLRLHSQHLACRTCETPGELIRHLGAMQAQDYASALWGIGVRLPGITEAGVEAAFATRKIVRTWPMRGTLHLVPAEDAAWMLALMTPRILAGSARRRQQLELSGAVFARCRTILECAMHNETALTRQEIFAALEHGGITVTPSRGYHIIWRLAQEAFLCGGPRRGKEATFLLLEEWVKKPRHLTRDAALVEIARRYFRGHGPATLRDFVWWTGLRVSEARQALAGVAAELEHTTCEDQEYWFSPPRSALSQSASGAIELLPAFDELLLGYTDRSASLATHHAPLIVPGGNGVFLATLAHEGRMIGTWKRVLKTRGLVVTPTLFIPVSPTTRKKITAAATRYGQFLGVEKVTLSLPAAA